MSLLDGLLGGQQGNSLVAVAGQLIERAGGLQGLLGMLQQGGLSDVAQSWVGTGANQSVSAGQLGQALQGGGLGSLLDELAGQSGVDSNQLLGQLSQVLPQAVDHLTPDGQVPEASGSGFDLGSLAGLAGKLLS